MADTNGDGEQASAGEAPVRRAPWHDERPSYIDDEACRVALEELLKEAGVVPSMLRSRGSRQ